MLVQTLEIIHYPASGITESGGSWESIYQHDPNWNDIERALRRLDRNVYPFVWLHISEIIDFDMPEHALNVLGGSGEYAIHIELPQNQLDYVDDARGDNIIDVWVSDQGYSTAEKNLCRDFELLLEIVKHFAETGKPYDKAVWR